MSASEFFPPNQESAFYVLSLRKPVHDPEGVSEVEGELVSALRLLAMAWPFSGGSFMVLDSRHVRVSGRFESNAERVRAELLAARGKRMVRSSATMPFETLATYDRPPLDVASVVHQLSPKRQRTTTGCVGSSCITRRHGLDTMAAQGTTAPHGSLTYTRSAISSRRYTTERRLRRHGSLSSATIGRSSVEFSTTMTSGISRSLACFHLSLTKTFTACIA
jgi:hypothetical protein